MRKRRVEKIQRGVLLFKTKLFCALINPRAHQADLLSGQRLRGRTEIARPVTRGIRALRATRWRWHRVVGHPGRQVPLARQDHADGASAASRFSDPTAKWI